MPRLGLVLLTALLAAAAPASAQIDLSGEWSNRYHEDAVERGPGPDIGDYLGLPVNDAGRMRADAWSPSLLTVPEHQCKPHPADYGPSVSDLRITRTIDSTTQQVVAWRTHLGWMEAERDIWMDGRPHPPAHAAHTWQGFSTGTWRGNVLTVRTTHLKAAHVRRNGIARSDAATLTEHFIRHDDVLTWVTIVDDPAYLTEPMVRTRNFVLDPEQQIGDSPCLNGTTEVAGRDAGAVPHYLPGENPYLDEFAERYGLGDAVRGGAETMYPEYQQIIEYDPPAACTRYCNCVGIQGVACPVPAAEF